MKFNSSVTTLTFARFARRSPLIAGRGGRGTKTSKKGAKSGGDSSKGLTSDEIRKEIEGIKGFGGKGWKVGGLKQELDGHGKGQKKGVAAIVHGGRGKVRMGDY